MIDYLTHDRTVGTYETMSGEHGFVRYTLINTVAAIPDYSGATTHREIIETVFVSADDAAFATLVLSAEDPSTGLANILASRHIDFRLAHGVYSSVRQLPVKTIRIVTHSDNTEAA